MSIMCESVTCHLVHIVVAPGPVTPELQVLVFLPPALPVPVPHQGGLQARHPVHPGAQPVHQPRHPVLYPGALAPPQLGKCFLSANPAPLHPLGGQGGQAGGLLVREEAVEHEDLVRGGVSLLHSQGVQGPVGVTSATCVNFLAYKFLLVIYSMFYLVE